MKQFRHQARITEESNNKPQKLLSAVTFESRNVPNANSYQGVTFGRYKVYAAQTVCC